MRKLIHATVIDDLIEAYVDWGDESAEVEYAYRRWSVAPSPDAALAFAAYAAALDREEMASIRYARLIRRAFVLLERDRRRRRRRAPVQRAVRGRDAGRRGRRRMRRLSREAGSRARRTRTV